ncbi:NfeD family protein [Sedimentibacter sp. MB31-C6]|uniref:NfeD family protein n=1 Tax=Sedimentibacter sp. MB31-C6 TaxID=3109366 RepID=UPI002DDCC4F7|nr:NfeD family protein [Sedimentibacter sp. MB36-C1]WSI05512.1 NfeD family protein [Sedimentibacter sp. MB36-C1]
MGYIGWTWLGIIVACLVIEASTLGLATIWFAIGALAALIIYIIGFSIQIQIVIFLVVSVICLIFTRPIAVEKLKIGKTRTNADSLIGEYVKVQSRINNIDNEGTVKVRGQVWSARASNDEVIEKDEIVLVKEIRGVKLIVERKK